MITSSFQIKQKTRAIAGAGVFSRGSTQFDGFLGCHLWWPITVPAVSHTGMNPFRVKLTGGFH